MKTMRKFPAIVWIVCFFPVTFLQAQRVHIGVFGGLSAYNGDLTENIFPKKVTNGAIGLTAGYELTESWMLRAGLTYTVVGGADRYSEKTDLRIRNLSFETNIVEFSLVGEYYPLGLYERRYAPYLFGGLAVFRFDPYTYDAAGQKIYLQPLGTEGQGITGYPDPKLYSRIQPAIPFGGGVKFALTDALYIGIEGGFRKLFTDYLDDVSKNSADESELLEARGPLAVAISYRGDEAGGSPLYPVKGAQRGSPKNKDVYYFAGIHLSYKPGGGQGVSGGGRKNRTGCPANVY